MSTRVKDIFSADLEKMTFGDILKAFRSMHDITQEKLGKKLGISRQNVCDLEKGRQSVTADTAKRYAKKLGISEIVAVKACLQDQLSKANMKNVRLDLKKEA